MGDKGKKDKDKGRKQKISKESCPVRPIPAYKAGLYGLTENRQLSESNSKPPSIPVHRTGFSGCLNKQEQKAKGKLAKQPKRTP